METRITATELARRLSDVLSRVQYRGERFVVERGGERVAVLEPSHGATPGITLRGLAERLRAVRPDDAFADDLEALQAAQPPADRCSPPTHGSLLASPGSPSTISPPGSDPTPPGT